MTFKMLMLVVLLGLSEVMCGAPPPPPPDPVLIGGLEEGICGVDCLTADLLRPEGDNYINYTECLDNQVRVRCLDGMNIARFKCCNLYEGADPAGGVGPAYEFGPIDRYCLPPNGHDDYAPGDNVELRFRCVRNPVSGDFEWAYTDCSFGYCFLKDWPLRCLNCKKCLRDFITPCEPCGIREVEPVSEIIGGDDAIRNSWPWMVQLRYGIFGGPVLQVRQGVIVSERHILLRAIEASNAGADVNDQTACPNDALAANITVIVGGHNLEGTDGVPHAGKCLRINPEYYSPQNSFNAWALLELEDPIEFGRNATKICIEDDFQLEEGDICTIAGWGFPRPDNDVLQELQVAVVDDTNCNGYGSFDPNFSTCFESPEVGSLCLEDWGGPVMCQRNDQFVLYGMAHLIFPFGCGNDPNNPPNPPLPFAVLRVDFQFPWIVDNITP